MTRCRMHLHLASARSHHLLATILVSFRLHTLNKMSSQCPPLASIFQKRSWLYHPYHLLSHLNPYLLRLLQDLSRSRLLHLRSAKRRSFRRRPITLSLRPLSVILPLDYRRINPGVSQAQVILSIRKHASFILVRLSEAQRAHLCLYSIQALSACLTPPQSTTKQNTML